MNFLQLCVQFCRIRRFRRIAGKLLILLAGLHKLLLQILQIDVFKPPCFQRCNFTLQFLNPHSQSVRQFFAALPLLLRQIQLAAQIDCVLFQFPDLLPAILEKRLKRRKLHTGQSLLRLRIELSQNVGLRNGREIPRQ